MGSAIKSSLYTYLRNPHEIVYLKQSTIPLQTRNPNFAIHPDHEELLQYLKKVFLILRRPFANTAKMGIKPIHEVRYSF